MSPSVRPGECVAARLDRDFKLADRDEALYVMDAVLASDPERTADGMERIHAAMLRLASGNLQRLLDAAALAELDWRDLFMDAGLGSEDWRDRIAEELGPEDINRSSDVAQRRATSE